MFVNLLYYRTYSFYLSQLSVSGSYMFKSHKFVLLAVGGLHHLTKFHFDLFSQNIRTNAVLGAEPYSVWTRHILSSQFRSCISACVTQSDCFSLKIFKPTTEVVICWNLVNFHCTARSLWKIKTTSMGFDWLVYIKSTHWSRRELH